MFTWICPRCGREVPPSQDACPDCGSEEKSGAPAEDAAAVAGQPVAHPPVAPAADSARRRVAAHLRLIIVLWLAQGVLRLLSMIPGLLMWFPTGMLPAMPIAGSLVHLQFPLTVAESAFLLVISVWTVACLVVAWSLLERARWARTYAIVVSAIWLLDFPLGTALGIYTLWVLLPESSEAEYRELAMP
jgi:hypothetical protein